MAYPSALDTAVQQHMQHPAMPVGDCFTESMYEQLEAPAREGGTPAGPAAAPLTPAQLQAVRDAAGLGAGVQRLLIATAVAPLVWHLALRGWQWLAGS